MIQLKLHGADESKASSDTRTVRWTDFSVCGWLCSSQVWTFEGDVEGDAICVPVRSGTLIVIRTGETIRVTAADRGIRGVLESLGHEVAQTVL